jgi:hypothetical protein
VRHQNRHNDTLLKPELLAAAWRGLTFARAVLLLLLLLLLLTGPHCWARSALHIQKHGLLPFLVAMVMVAMVMMML